MTRSAGEVGPPSDRRTSDHDARVRVEFAAPAAEATPLAELGPTTRDLTRVQPLLEQLAAAVASLLSTDMAIVWTTDPSEDLLLPSAWVGFPEEYVAPMRVPYGTGSAGRAVLERRTVLVEDIATSDHYGAYAKGALEHGVRTVLSVPMLTLGGAPMGALTTYYRSAFAPDERDLEVADVYARQAAEIVERARLHAEARQLAALEQRRSAQLSALARSALALSATDSQDQLVELVTEAAVDVIGCHQGVTSLVQGDWARATTYVALSDAYEQWHDYREPPVGLGLPIAVTRDQRPLRLTGEQLLAHPDYRGLRDATGHPPLPDYLAAPLIGRDGSNGGLIQLSHKKDGTSFTAEDEAMLVQLAQMASATVERIEAFAGERRARREAEQAALLQGVLSDASGVFAESFDPRAIGAALVQLVVPRLATVSVLHLVDEAGDLVMDACSAGGRRAADRGPRLLRRRPGAVRLAVRSGGGAAQRAAAGHRPAATGGPRLGDRRRRTGRRAGHGAGRAHDEPAADGPRPDAGRAEPVPRDGVRRRRPRPRAGPVPPGGARAGQRQPVRLRARRRRHPPAQPAAPGADRPRGPDRGRPLPARRSGHQSRR
jgi:GAF domain-containing protein